MNKNQAKEEIKKLIAKYEQIKNSAKIKSYTEEETKNAFIKPLFEALGWDFSEKEEVSAEEHVSLSGRLDYGFHINGRPKFYLEVKKLKADLNNEEFARQAIKYSFNKGVTWAVLSDFEGIKVFNAQSPSKYLGDKLYFELKYSEYFDRFEKLWELSKESFEEDLIDKKAIEAGKKLQKIPITELLSKDLNECRRILTEELGKWNPKVPQALLDEGVQKLLDRIIFIKVAEDRKIENNVLLPLINQWRLLTGSNKPTLYQSMTKKFRELDDIYNSNIFKEHPFEKWEESGEVLEKILDILNGKKGYYEFDFSVMSADTLGSVYENYLGYKLSQSQKGLTLHKDAGKRKEQGIYYTPPFIVDYIVRNALKPILDKCKSVNDLKKIKVLDPACGSGSFLIKALEVILEKYEDFNYKDDETLRIEIILENLFGVDLDEQAVEIARLNLLINALEERGKLPSLENNIKNGNSLISGTDEELEKYFGKNFREKKPFNWKEEFPKVFEQGGFDVIVGNPPYIRQEEIKEYKSIFLKLFPNVANGTADLYVYFFERGLQLLKKDGMFAFITSNKFIRSGYGKNLRYWLRSNFMILQIIDKFEKRVFADAAVDPCIVILKKEKPINNNYLSYNYDALVPQNYLSDSGWTLGETRVLDLKDKVDKQGKKMKEWENIDIYRGVVTGLNEAFILNENKKKELIKIDKACEVLIKPLITGKNIKRYSISFDKQFLIKVIPGTDISSFKVIYDHLMQFKAQLEKRWEPVHGKIKWYELRPCVYYEKFEEPKIIYPDISSEGGFYWDNNGYFFNNTAYMITGNIKKSWIGLFNSKLMSWYYKQIASGLGENVVRYFTQFMEQLPIAEDTSSLDSLTQKMLDLHKDLRDLDKNSNKWNSIREEIERTDKKIDEEVYKLYGLTPEEIKIVESS